MNNTDEILGLDNQFCFALCVSLKEVIRRHKPFLEPLRLIYTGYITMMVLWEKGDISVKDLGNRLTLDSDTLTPLLKRLESFSYIERIRGDDGERSVCIHPTEDGRASKAEAVLILEQMICTVGLMSEELGPLLGSLQAFISDLTAES